jgi:hypothetical protein
MLEFKKLRWMRRLQHCNSNSSTAVAIPALESKQQRWIWQLLRWN